LLRQKKGTKEKATPLRRPLRGFPALLNGPGGCGTRLRLAETPGPSSLLGGVEGDKLQSRVQMRPPAVSFSFGFDLSCPVWRRATQGGAEMGEFRSPRSTRVAQGSGPKARRQTGRAFFLATFSWQDKKKNARRSTAEHSVSDIRK
jgi:hypothetical protein